jgi:hypothetical protein
MLKILATILIIVFNFLILSCITIDNNQRVDWLEPSNPIKKQIKSIPLRKGQLFIPSEDGIFFDKESSSNLVFNIEELDAYIEKQKMLIEQMKRYYKAK